MTFVSTLLDLVFPRVCVNCGGRVEEGSLHVCWDCAASFTLVKEPHCSLCGDPVDGRVENLFRCSFCRRNPPHFDLARSALRYIGDLRDTLHAFKYSRKSCLSGDFVRWLAACHRMHYSGIDMDAITCVPLHGRRQRDRTYNQAGLLARDLARELSVPVFTRCLKRVRPTESQISLNAAQRRANVRGAFSVEDAEWVEGRRLLVVDDIMTTGATVNECSRVLKRAGAASVYVLTVARG